MCYHAIAIQDFSREMRLEIANNSLAKGLKRAFSIDGFPCTAQQGLIFHPVCHKNSEIEGKLFFQYKNRTKKQYKKLQYKQICPNLA